MGCRNGFKLRMIKDVGGVKLSNYANKINSKHAQLVRLPDHYD